MTDYRNVTRVLTRMEKDRHAVSHATARRSVPDIDIFDREACVHRSAAIEVGEGIPRASHDHMEHLSSKQGADFVKSAAPQVGGTIYALSPQSGRGPTGSAQGIKPMMYAMPVIKTANDRAALRKGRHVGSRLLFPRH